MRKRPRLFEEDLTGALLDITEVVQASTRKKYHWGQVYRAVLHPPLHAADSAFPDESKTRTSVDVIVKIYQGSISHIYDQWRLDIDDAFTMYRTEQWAYKRMRALQGIVVPHIAGFYEVMLRNDEPAIVLVMEYVPTATPAQLLEPPAGLTEDDMYAGMLRGMATAMHHILSCEVEHCDIQFKNIRWPYYGTGHFTNGWMPVFVDFGICKRAYPGSFEGNKVIFLSNALRCLMEELRLDRAKLFATLQALIKEKPEFCELFGVNGDDARTVDDVIPKAHLFL